MGADGGRVREKMRERGREMKGEKEERGSQEERKE